MIDCANCDSRVCRDGEDCLGRRDEMVGLYDDPEVQRIAYVAGQIETTLYNEACRLEELIAFARSMGWRRLGVAFCIGLANEAERLVEILQSHFEVASICCKVCGISDEHWGEQKAAKGITPIACNPRAQAEILNEEETDLNVLVGLCIGHDILFTRYSKAPVTTFVVKDRPLAHNPVGAVYSRYVRRRLERRVEDRKGDMAAAPANPPAPTRAESKG